MIRRTNRERREYIYRKQQQVKAAAIQKKKDTLKNSLDENKRIPTELRRDALFLQDKLKWDDNGPELAKTYGESVGDAFDDEYRWAGVEDPKVMITTSRDPSSRLKMFTKEMRLCIPNSQKINRGNGKMLDLVNACRANGCTDLVIFNETRGRPDTMIISHLPYGPTAKFNLFDTIFRHDIPDIGPMSEQYPHLIFHNFKTKLGQRTMDILKYLFPVPKTDSKRVMTFANHNDFISFRHHTMKKVNGRDIELTEVGPRFQFKLFELKLGTIDTYDSAQIEWVDRVNMNTSHKRRFLSEDDGWVVDEEEEDPIIT